MEEEEPPPPISSLALERWAAAGLGPVARAEAAVCRKRLYRGRGAASRLHAISVRVLLLSLVPLPDCPEYARCPEYGVASATSLTDRYQLTGVVPVAACS